MPPGGASNDGSRIGIMVALCGASILRHAQLRGESHWDLVLPNETSSSGRKPLCMLTGEVRDKGGKRVMGFLTGQEFYEWRIEKFIVTS